VGAAPTTTGRAGTARRLGPGKRDDKVQLDVNQWWNPLKRPEPGSNLMDMGRAAVRGRSQCPTDRLQGDVSFGRLGGHVEGLRRRRGEAAGEELGTSLVERSAVNVGTTSGSLHAVPSIARLDAQASASAPPELSL
jgi:hypothetical protein